MAGCQRRIFGKLIVARNKKMRAGQRSAGQLGKSGYPKPNCVLRKKQSALLATTNCSMPFGGGVVAGGFAEDTNLEVLVVERRGIRRGVYQIMGNYINGAHQLEGEAAGL